MVLGRLLTRRRLQLVAGGLAQTVEQFLLEEVNLSLALNLELLLGPLQLVHGFALGRHFLLRLQQLGLRLTQFLNCVFGKGFLECQFVLDHLLLGFLLVCHLVFVVQFDQQLLAVPVQRPQFRQLILQPLNLTRRLRLLLGGGARTCLPLKLLHLAMR